MPYMALTQTADVRPETTRETVSTPIQLAALPPMSVLFVSQPHTGRIGGIQRHSQRLYEALQPQCNVARWPDMKHPLATHLFLSNKHDLSNKSHLSNKRDRYGSLVGRPVIYCDAGIAIIFATRLFRRSDRVKVGTVHGLDMIAPLKPYQQLMTKALRRLDTVVCVSQATAAQVEARGVPEERIRVIHNAAEPKIASICTKEQARQQLRSIIGADLRGKKVLLSIGRPIKRKGFDTFVSSVFRYLPDDYVYIVAGPEVEIPGWLRAGSAAFSARSRRNILVAMGYHSSHANLKRQSKHPRMFYLNGASDSVRDLLYAACDLFVLPNRTVQGDMEGFGIVALEAATRGIPVVAFGIEGITDAVIHGRNGICVEGRDYLGLRQTIQSLLSDPIRLEKFGQEAAEFTRERYSLEKVTGQYISLFEELAYAR